MKSLSLPFIILCCVNHMFAQEQTDHPSRTVLITVNGIPVTQGDLDFLSLSRRIPKENLEERKQQLLNLLVEQRLIQGYLDTKKVEVETTEIEQHIAFLHSLIKESGKDPQTILKGLGYTSNRLKQEVRFPLAWKNYLNRVVTPESLRKYFQVHHAKFDGTRVRARQIFLKANSAEPNKVHLQAKELLTTLRSQMESGSLSFEEAVEKHSQAPSKKKGGDVGFFPYRGRMPVAVAQAAFQLELNELSQPVVSPFGWHLIQVTEIKQGTFSLEDVRRRVKDAYAKELWQKLVAKEKKKAKIEWKTDQKSGL